MNKTIISKLLLISIAFSSISSVIAEPPDKEFKVKHPKAVSWAKAPRVRISDHELKGMNRLVVIRMYVDSKGLIERTIITQSSGISSIDAEIQRAIKIAKFRPYQENGVALPFIAEQPFNLIADPSSESQTYKSQSNQCIIDFNSIQWTAQQKEPNTNFKYVKKPDLYLLKSQLDNQNREVAIEFKLSTKNEISDISIVKSSGLASIDQHVIEAMRHSKLEATRKFYQFYKLKFSDQVYFNLDECQ